MRLILLSNEYIVNLDLFREALFDPSDGDHPATLTIYLDDDDETVLRDDEAITVWYRLRGLCADQAAGEGHADG